MYKMHHPNSDVDRMYLPRTEGGRGIIQLDLSYKTATIDLDINTSRRRRKPSSPLWKNMTTGNPFNPSADSQWSSVGNQDCLQYHLWGWGEHLLCLQNKGQGQTPGSPTAQVQVGIKSAPRQIATVAERGWREPRQSPLLAKSNCPQGINGGLYHCSPKSKPPKTLVSIQHPHEDWREPKMQTVWPFRWDHWPSGHWLSWTV